MKFSSKKIQAKLKERNGFTLAEMIITVAIIAVLTGITAVGVYGYLSSAYTTKVSETARTIFYASQNYLLEQKQMGKLESFNQSAATYGAKVPWDDLKEILSKNRPDFDEKDYKDNYAIDSTRYILMEKGSTSTNPLYRIVEQATHDKSLLSHTFLLEYDETTGVVRSVFYSEKADLFSYDKSSGAMASKENVILRSPDSIYEKKQGYYGVDITGKKPASEVYLNEPVNVTLFNGERLYLQWTDKNASNPEFELRPELLDELLYDITVYRQTSAEPEALIQFQNIQVADLSANITLDQADDKVLSGEGYRLAYKKDLAAKTGTYQLILDDIHQSIFKTYTSKNTGLPTNIQVEKDVLAEDILYCTVTIKLNKVTTGLDATALPASSNVQSSAFGGGEKEVQWMNPDGTTQTVSTNASGVLEDGTKEKTFSVWNPRHLENVRYGQNKKENAYFTQNASIDWKVPEGRSGKGIAYRSIVYYGEAMAEKPFAGNYTVLKNGANYYPLKNISILQKEDSMVGFISQNMGTISGLNLENPVVEGSLLTGVVTGVNGGTIEHISIKTGKVTGSHLLGGITGYNTAAGSIQDVNSLVQIDGTAPLSQEKTITDIESFKVQTKGRYVGGLIGLNKGKAQKLTTQKSTVTGTAYVGGILGSNLAAESIKLSDLSNRNDIKLTANASASENLEYFGGLVGYQDKSTVLDGTNYGLLNLAKPAAVTNADKLKHVGGIAGYNNGILETCVNEGGSDRLGAIQTTCIDQIKKGTLPSYFGKYVGGIVGTNTKDAAVRKCYNNNAVILGNSIVGGFIGNNHGTDIDVKSNTDMSGLVIGSEYLVGGIFGYNAGENIENYVNQANVFGKGMVGGITGLNGKIAGDSGEDKVLNYLNDLEKKTGTDYLSSLLEVEERLSADSSSKINSCENKGFVYAQRYFAGGLTGVNYGEIVKSKVVNNVSFPEIIQLGKADCVGGVAGFNGTKGAIDGSKGTKQTVQTNLVANSFVGGIVGLNRGKISGFMQVTGTVYGKGDCVGGVIGLNTNSNAVSNLTNNATANIEGAYFVGGIMGCNVAISTGENTRIEQVTSGNGAIVAQAYAGGILGYNAYVDSGTTIGSLFGDLGELSLLKKNAYAGDQQPGGALGDKTTVFVGCDSKANVQANRYVGGIIGYNSSRANLWVVSSNNNGAIKITTGSKVDPAADGATYYYIGGITGRNSPGGIIHKCNNNGSVQSPSTYLGGICEVNEGYVQFCGSGKNEATGVEFGTNGDNSVGGIAGLNRTGGYIVSCTADSYSKIKGKNRTGGLVGTNDAGGVITSNYNGNEAKTLTGVGDGTNPKGEDSLSFCNAKVIGEEDTGGIVGYNNGSIAYVLVNPKAEITGTINVGGFVGNNAKDATVSGKTGTIENLVNNAKVYGNHEVGGIVGKHNVSKILNCENRGEVKAIGNKFGYAGGITGSNAKEVTIENCVNYGLVRSEHSFAGGITGLNDGTLRNSDNYGSVQGSFEEISVGTEADGVRGAAIGGVAGCNYRDGKIYECASRKNDKGDNKIQGNYLVGGIIGYYDRSDRTNGELRNTTSKSLTVDITIEPQDKKVEIKGTDKRCAIGGIIGTTDPSPRSTVLKDYIFTGTIQISNNAGKNQQEIGGIIGSQKNGVTLENCMFDGKITGYGNNPDDNDYAGIGGLAGSSWGTILVYPSEVDGDTVYTSNTKKSSIEGIKRVGGVVGETITKNALTFTVKLKVDGKDIPLNEVNQDRQPNEYLYYDNYATIKASRWVGGFYGSVEQTDAVMKNLRNNGNLESKAGSQDPSSMGGIAGATRAKEMSNCQNYGDIGKENEDKNITSNVGGLVGYWDGNAASNKRATISNCINTGFIHAGKANIGGLFGTLKNADLWYNCMSMSRININKSKVSSVSSIGGIIGSAGNVKIVNDTGKLQSMILNPGAIEISVYGRASQIGGVIGSVVDSGTVSMEYIENQLFIGDSSYTAEHTQGPNQNQSVQTGGLIGNVSGSGELILKNCVNSANIMMVNGKEVGGLVGKIEGRKITIIDSKNKNKKALGMNGNIQGGDCVAGIVGFISGGNIVSFQRNTNDSEINGRIAVGGIVGNIKNANGTIESCENAASATIIINEVRGGNSTRNIGGCFGVIEGTDDNNKLTIETSKNAGTIKVNEGKVFADMSNVGGLTGYLVGEGAFINNSSNSGSVILTAANNADQKASAVGGIAGRISKKAMIGQKDSKNVRTTNTGDVTILGGTNNNVSQVGGIVGLADEESRILYCSNQGDVTASMESSKDVGGIAGKSSTAVYSCRTEKNPKIEGNQNVGGLVGTASSYASKVTSVGPNVTGEKGYDLSFVDANIRGREKVGGVVGYLQEGTVYNVFVEAAATITLDRETKDTLIEKAVGGIVGYAGPLDEKLGAKLEAQGIVSSCYNFGTVKDTNASNALPYIGSVIGYRKHLPEKAAVKIVDCFNFDAANTSRTTPPLWEDKYEGTVDEAAWAVGNEPFVTDKSGTGGIIYKDQADEQTYTPTPGSSDPLDTAEKFGWSEVACNALRTSLGIKDSPYPYDSKDAILEIMQKYDGFKLPPPELTSIIPVKGTQYTYTLKALPGFYTEYGFRVYDGDHEIGKVIPPSSTKTGIETKHGNGTNIIYDFKKDFTLDLETILGTDKLKNLVGKTLSVTTYAKGYSPDDLHYSKESDEIVLMQMVIMPPLPKPSLTSIAPTITDTDWFDAEGRQVKTKLEITNWAEYKTAADLVYTNLSTVKDDDSQLFEPDLYDEFLRGLLQFEMTDTFVDSSTADLSNTRIDHVIMQKDDANPQNVYYEVVGDKAYITIDYTGNTIFNNNSGNKPWHAYEAAAKIKADARVIPIYPKDPAFKYRYTDSVEKRGKNFRLKTKLKPPKNLKTEYLGKRDPNDVANPLAYSLKWEKDGGLDSTILGYKVELEYLQITEKDGTVSKISLEDRNVYNAPPYVTQVSGVKTTQLKLTMEQIMQIFTDCLIDPPQWWGEEPQYTLGYHVTTLSNKEEECISSEKSITSEFPLIKQQPNVTEIAANKDASGTNMTISWKDINFDPTTPGITDAEKKKHKYDITYQIQLNNEVIQTATKTGADAITGAVEWNSILLDPRLKDSSFSVTVQIVKQGVEGTDPTKVSLSSNMEEKEIIIGDRLEVPIDYKLRADKVENVDGAESLFLHLTWGNGGKTGADGIKPIDETNCSGYQIDIVTAGQEDTPISVTVKGWDTLETDVVIPIAKGAEVQYNIRALGMGSVEKSEWVKQTTSFSDKTMKEPKVEKVEANGEELALDLSDTGTNTISFNRGDYPSGENYKVTAQTIESDVKVGEQKIQIYHNAELMWEGVSIPDSAGTTATLAAFDPKDGKAIDLAGEDVTIRISNASEDIKAVLPSKAAEFTVTMPKIKLDSPGKPVLSKKEIVEIVPYDVYHTAFEVYGNVGDTDEEDKAIRKEENEARKGQQIRLLDKDDNEVSFILMKPKEGGTGGYEPIDGSEITSYEVSEEEQVEFYFRLPESYSGKAEDCKLVVGNKANEDPDPGYKKYSDSEEIEVLLDNIPFVLTLNLFELLPEELLPLPEEETTENVTTENSTTESGTTEESTTKEHGTTEESTTKEHGTTEESTTKESTTKEHGTTEESTTKESTTKEHGSTEDNTTKEHSSTKESNSAEETTKNEVST